MLRLFRMRHNGPQIRVLDVHIGICDVHHRLCCKVMAKLSRKLQLLDTSGVRGLLLGRGWWRWLLLGLFPRRGVVVWAGILGVGRR